jgi:hypothetical protein
MAAALSKLWRPRRRDCSRRRRTVYRVSLVWRSVCHNYHREALQNFHKPLTITKQTWTLQTLCSDNWKQRLITQNVSKCSLFDTECWIRFLSLETWLQYIYRCKTIWRCARCIEEILNILQKNMTAILQTCLLRTVGNEQFLENFSTAFSMRLIRPLLKETVRDSTLYTTDILQY